MNYRFLEGKIDEMRALPQFADSGADVETLIAFSRAFENLHGWELIRMNPFAFAERFDFRPGDGLSLFVLGAKAGLFVFEWSLLCPRCGYRELSFGSLRAIDRDGYRCSVCETEAAVRADDRLEAAFTMPPSLSGEWPDTPVAPDAYAAYFFAAPFGTVSGPDEAFRFIALPPGKRARIRLDARTGGAHRLESLETHSVFTVGIKDDPDRAPAPIELEYADAGFNRRGAFAPPVPTEVALVNRSRRAAGFLIGPPAGEFFRSAADVRPPAGQSFCSGKTLLNNQTFRDLFRAEDLPDNLSLPVDDLTVLCAWFPEQAGPEGAARSRRRLGAFRAVVRAHGGAVLGDGRGRISASFDSPLDGTRAAVGLLGEPDVAGEDGLGAKIGVHRGPAVAVKADGAVDFFGRTLNVASRLPGAAGPGEILVTEDVMREGLAAAWLRRSGYSAVRGEAAVGGAGDRMTVYSCKR